MSMSSSRPYMVRGIYEWILDNDCTPYILVNATASGVEVPAEYVQNGQIILNISPTAVANLEIANDNLRFNGRFGGVARNILVPMPALLGIYARENGQGMLFEMEEPTPPQPETPGPGGGRPNLKVVK